ncbi:hypothetical protein K1719_031814 [Acacia pycnantha]|nr:hypothetical protein K1719_031814 [Acacia pycnantha]
MENRGQKRPDMVDELPADKRMCSSLDLRPSSSNTSNQIHTNSTHSMPETQDDMEQQYSSLRGYHRQRLSSDHGKFKNIISSLSEETEPSAQLALLTELCEVLSFCTEGSLSSMTSGSLSPPLVKLAKHDSNPDIMLLAIRAITYICDVYPRSAGILASHDAISALCQRLLTIDYLDVAEQCLQALEKISREQPLACLRDGAIMAVLSNIEFFSTSIQRVALSTVVNICKKLPSESLSPCMEALPTLCNLLHYEDRQLVENVATCLIKIVERAGHSSKLLDELCEHGLIQQVSDILSSNGRTTLSQPIYNGLIGLLVKISSGSVVAFRTLYELNISNVLKDILATSDLPHGVSSSHPLVGHCSQVYEVLKLLNELLPRLDKDQNDQLLLDKESFLVNNPDHLQKFAMDVVPLLIQVFNSGASLNVCHGCLFVMHKLVYLSTSDMLVESLKKASISSFLAGVFTQKDRHLLILALQIAEIILHKFSDNFLKLFIKEGVFFAIDSLLAGSSSELMYPVFAGTQLAFDSRQMSSSRDLKCLCYAFSTNQSCTTTSDAGTCKLEKDSIINVAKHIKSKFLAPELYDSEKGLTEILQNLRALSMALNDLLGTPTSNSSLALPEEKVDNILYQIMEKLSGKEQVSTFEFIESGIVKSLINYLSNGLLMRNNGERQGGYDAVIEKRFEVLARVCLSYPQLHSGGTPLSFLIRNLQSALVSLEAFPVILSNGLKLRGSYAVVPNRCPISYPCLKVRFVKGEGETCLNNYTEDFLAVDPFSSLHTIEGYLRPKVSLNSTNHVKLSSSQVAFQAENPPVHLPSNASSSQVNIGLASIIETQGEETELLQPRPDQAVSANPGESSSSETLGHEEREPQLNAEAGPKLEGHLASCSNETEQKLVFYLEEQQLDPKLTLYQAILGHVMKKTDSFSVAKLWSQVHTITYRMAVKSEDVTPPELLYSPEDVFLIDKVAAYMQCTPFFSDIFEARCKYFKLAAFGLQQSQPHDSATISNGRLSLGALPRKKFLVYRNRILESAAQMMDSHARHKGVLEVEYDEEVGTGLGPTLEFYTLVCQEFEKSGMGMWREDNWFLTSNTNLQAKMRILSPYGLFPCPWPSTLESSGGVRFSEVTRKFFLLGQVVAKALRDGRVLDLHFSKAFYKLILGKELSLYDIQSFDPGLGSVLQEFQAIVNRKKKLESVCGDNYMMKLDACFRDTRIEDLCLDFTLPGYPDIVLSSGTDHAAVNTRNLDDYVSLVVDATVKSGISRQVEAFKSGFNQVFSIEHLHIFNEEELERLLCGEFDSWAFHELADHIKFDHGYTASSPPIVNLLEIIQEFDHVQRRAFLQFVTGAPRLPPGGLASLNPKLTVVRKHSTNRADSDLPSVMTCANYLKLPPYSSKEKMKEKLLYAITEGQGSFHLS